MTSEMAHTDIKLILSLHSEHVYKDDFCIETNTIMNYCATFRCTTHTGHHREANIYLMIPYESNVFETLNRDVSQRLG